MLRNKHLAAISVAAAVSCAPAVVTAQNEGPIDEITTSATPIRDSQAAAIEAKRNSDRVVEIISADLVGRFPDQNLADSLGRIPGLAIERDQGQARYINFRGAPFRYTAIGIDGIDVPGAENGRIPRFDSYPAVITSRIEANKAITADLPGESVAGYINLQTFDPFSIEGWSGSLEGGLGEQNLGGGDIEKMNGRFSFSNETFGAVLFASRNLREQVTDNREYDLEIDPASGEIVTNTLDYRSYFVDREDNAWGGRLEVRPAGSEMRFFFSSVYNEFVDEEERNQFVFDIADGANAIDSAVVPGDTGYQPLVLVTRALQDGRYENSTFTNTFGFDFIAGDWIIDTRLNYTTTEFSTFLPLPFSVGGQAAASYDISNIRNPELQLFQPFTQDALDLADVEYATTLGLQFGQDLDIDVSKFRLDADREIQLFGRDTAIKTGFQIEQRQAEGYGNSLVFGGFPDTVDIDSFNTGAPWFTDLTNSIGGTYYDNIGVSSAWAADIGGLTPPRLEEQRVLIDENIAAAYVMTTSTLENGNFVLGLRIENTDFTTQGPSIDVEFDNSYTNVLPNAHLNLDLSDTLKLRISASTGISRPTYVEARASAIVDPVERSVVGGNPRLDEETSVGGDVALEWYYADASLLSVGVFYRAIDNVIYSDVTTVDGGAYLDSAAGQDWRLVGFVNGDNGYFAGAELNYIGQMSEGPLQGLGFSGNVTVLDSEFETQNGVKIALPGTSDLIFNASVFYENFGLSARLNYQYRDTWLTSIEDVSFGEFWDEQQRVDLSVRYQLPFDDLPYVVTLFGDINNITEEEDLRFIGQIRTPNQFEGYGRRWLVGVRADF